MGARGRTEVGCWGPGSDWSPRPEALALTVLHSVLLQAGSPGLGPSLAGTGYRKEAGRSRRPHLGAFVGNQASPRATLGEGLRRGGGLSHESHSSRSRL